jgi:heterodisulfide reductase subunit B
VSLIKPDMAARLVNRLAARAREAGAEAMVTSCPLCQVNLEMRQSDEPKMPSLYITELLGLALGLPQVGKWLSKHLIDPRPLIQSVGLLAE